MATEVDLPQLSQDVEFDYLENFSMAKEIFRDILTTKNIQTDT